MIKPNWDTFSSKFSTDKESTFEWFTYLLFCREFNLPKGWFGFKNQSGIEKNPIEHEGHVIGFQAKFYSSSLADHKDDFLQMLEKSNRDYPSLTKILIYTNQLWGQAYNKKEEKMTSPKALLDIENKAQELNISIEWREASFFESEFVCLEHDDLSKYFFTEQPQHGWQRFDDWSNTKSKLEEEYFIDDNVKVISPNHQQNHELNVVDGINEIRQKLRSTNTSVRLVGLSGVGKTRFAQALFDERIGENSLDHRNVWYCDLGDSPIPMPEHFIEDLKQKNKPYILIVDNCGQDVHANLTRKVQNSQIALMTIEYDIKDDLPEKTNAYKLKPISVEIVQKVVERHYPHINNLNSHKIAEFSGGNYRLALAIASNIDKTDNLALLTDGELFERLFWQKGQKNDELFRITKNFALVYSFNIEDSGEENSELDFLADLAKVDSDTAIEAIETLKSKDIVQQRGKWRAILPHALANHLAKELISKKLVNQLDQLTKRMPERLKRSFIKRLSYLHDVPKVQELVTLWFSEEGLVGKKIIDSSYENQDLVEMSLLAPISEDQLLNLLEKKHYLDPNFLTRQNPHYVEISNLIRFLAYEERNFKKAFELLIYFAKDEKEDERNHSIRKLITSLFRLYASETSANLEIKKEALNSLKANPQYQSLLLDCLSKALNFHVYGSLILANQSGKNLDFGYQPATFDELWAWVIFLLEILNELDIQQVPQARKIFTDHLKEIIWKCRKIDIAYDYLNKFNSRNYFSEAHTKIINIIHCNSDDLQFKAPKLLADLKKIEKKLRPKKENISDLIKSYILISDHDLYRMTKDDDDDVLKIPEFDNYKELMDFIEIKLNDFQVLKDNISLLIKASSGFNQHHYLVELGQKIANTFVNVFHWIDMLKDVEIHESLNNSEFLLGILKSFKNINIYDYHTLIEYLASDEKYCHFINVIILETCENDEDFLYFSQFLKNNKNHKKLELSLAWRKHHNRITNEQFEILMDTLIEMEENEIVKNELQNECFFQKKIADKYKVFLLDSIYEIISNANFFNHFEDVCNYLLLSDSATNDMVFDNVKKFFETQTYISLYTNDDNFKILKLLIENNTLKFIRYFVEDSKFMQRFFMKDLVKVLAHANPRDVLNWIGTDQKKIDFWLENSRLFRTNKNTRSGEVDTETDIIWSDLMINLLDMKYDKAKSLEILFDKHVFRMSGVFSGSWSQAMHSRLPYLYSLRNKLRDKFPDLLELIDRKEKEWLQAVENQAKEDENQEKIRSERFEW